MKPQGNLEIYRVAYESASAELIEISEMFDKLRARVAQVEKVVAALKPLVAEEGNAPVESAVRETAPALAEAKPEAQADKDAESSKTGSDPFQHRINHVLGIGAGIRDVRSYTRQF